MKPLVALSVLQVMVLAVLVYKLVLLEDRIDSLSVTTEHVTVASSSTPAKDYSSVSQAEPRLDENRLRSIIRSELRSQFDAQTSAITDTAAESPQDDFELDPVEYAARREVARQELAYHIKQGEISDTEMQNLQTEISRLDPESRTALLRELTRALNSGELEGQF